MLSHSDKMDFSAEISIVVWLSGAVLAPILQLLCFADDYSHWSALVGLVFHQVIIGMWGLLLLIFLLRPLIYLLDYTSLSHQWQLVLSSVGGAGIVLLIIHLHLDLPASLTGPDGLATVLICLAYTIPYLVWNFLRNIWYRPKKYRILRKDILDDI